MTAKFRMLGKGCPICNGAKRGAGRGGGDCRQLEEIVHCRFEVSSVPGYRLLGVSRIGFNMWVPGDPGSDDKWKNDIERRIRRQVGEQSRKERFSKQLGIPERDSQYRAVAAQLGLNAEHQGHLTENRGLTPAEIKHAGFLSWIPSRKVSGASNSLPGIDKRGERLVGCRGIAIPALDPQGRITGYQIKTDSGRPGKYVWLSSHSDKDPNRPGPQLPNGELPLFAWADPSTQIRQVWLCEGALKSGITGFLTSPDIAVIGAAGGNFGSETLRDYVAQLDPAEGVILCPDAGSIQNPNIAMAYHRTLKWLQAWGCRVRVAWWGQTHKESHPDIDELLVAGEQNRIRFISPEEFFEFHPVKIREKLETHTIHRKGLKRLDYPVQSPFPSAKGSAQTYKEGQRIQTWIELGRQGHSAVVDQSGMGSGKSYDAGKLTPEDLCVDQVVYVTSDPRNVTTPTLQGWSQLNGRHGGLSQAPGPGGSTQTRRTKDGDPASTGPNCARHKLAEILPAKNVAATGEHICPGCPFLDDCRGGSGTYTYLGDRRDVLSQERFIAHINSLDPNQIRESKTALVIDEWTSVDPVKRYTAKPGDIDRTILDLQTDCPELAAKVTPLLLRIRSLLGGELPRYGLAHKQLMEQLGSIPDVPIEVIEASQGQELEWLVEAGEGVLLSDLPHKERRRFRQNTDALVDQAETKIALNWLPDFWRALHGEARIRLTHAGVEIAVEDPHKMAVLNNASLILVLDGTTPPDVIAEWLGKDPVVIKQEDLAQTANLEVIQVTGLGLLTSSRGDRQSRRARVVVEALKKQDPSTEVIDSREFARAGEGYWFRDSRGSNTMQKAATLVLSGIPLPNLGALQDEYALMTGRDPGIETVLRTYPIKDIGQSPGGPWLVATLLESADPGFAEFYRNAVLGEVDQAVARLRAARRPGKTLKVYLLSEYPLDRQVRAISAGELAPEAMTTADRIHAAIEEFTEEGIRLTQGNIAERIGVAQPVVSKTLAEVSNPCPDDDPGWFVVIPNAIDTTSKWNNYKPPETLTQQDFQETPIFDVEDKPKPLEPGDPVEPYRYCLTWVMGDYGREVTSPVINAPPGEDPFPGFWVEFGGKPKRIRKGSVRHLYDLAECPF